MPHTREYRDTERKCKEATQKIQYHKIYDKFSKVLFLHYKRNYDEIEGVFLFLSTMFSPKIRSLALITLLGFTFHTVSSIFLATFADNTGYYVDATLGNDANDGLAPGTAWQTLSRANAEVLLPGDQINLKCGETWSESLMFDESGISGNEIQVLPYGTCSASSFVTLNGTGAESIYI